MTVCKAYRCVSDYTARPQLVHDENHLRTIVRKTLISRLGGVTFVDRECTDLYFSPGTLHAARFAAGGAVAAVQALFIGSTPHRSTLNASFAIVRPPGHHCSRTTPAGFCFLSNTAIAAQYARRVLELERVAIVDTGECGRGDCMSAYVKLTREKSADYHPGEHAKWSDKCTIAHTDPVSRRRHTGDFLRRSDRADHFMSCGCACA